MNHKKNLLELLNYPVDLYFDTFTIRKSSKYLLGTRITDYRLTGDNFIIASIHGTKKYLTSMTVIDNELSFKCSCPCTGLCKHEAALYQYAQNKLNIKVYADDEILEMTVEEIYQDIKANINGRSYITYYNYRSFEDIIDKYADRVEMIYSDNKVNESISLFVKVLDALSRFVQINNNDIDFNNIVKKFIENEWYIIEYNFNIFKPKFNDILQHKKFIILEYLIISYNDYTTEYKDYIVEFFEKELTNASNIISHNKREELTELVFMMKIICQFKIEDYTNLQEVKKRLQIIDYRAIYLKYLININDIISIKDLYLSYNNYRLFSSELYDLYIQSFFNNDEYDFCEDAILNYVKYIDLNKTKINNIINTYSNKLSAKFFEKLGLAFYVSNKIDKLNSYSKNYEEFKKYIIAYNTFSKFDESFDKYKDDLADELKSMYYKIIIDLFKNDYLLSTITKKKVMKYVSRLHLLPNGDYYIYDIYEYFQNTRYRGIFPELEKYCNSLDL